MKFVVVYVFHFSLVYIILDLHMYISSHSWLKPTRFWCANNFNGTVGFIVNRYSVSATPYNLLSRKVLNCVGTYKVSFSQFVSKRGWNGMKSIKTSRHEIATSINSIQPAEVKLCLWSLTTLIGIPPRVRSKRLTGTLQGEFIATKIRLCECVQ